MCAFVLYRRVSRDDDDGDMTASTDSEMPKLDLAFKEGETIKTYITVLASAVSVGQTPYLNDETTDWLVAVQSNLPKRILLTQITWSCLDTM